MGIKNFHNNFLQMYRKINIFILLCLKTLRENNSKQKRIYYRIAQTQLSITTGQLTKNYQNLIGKKKKKKDNLKMNR